MKPPEIRPCTKVRYPNKKEALTARNQRLHSRRRHNKPDFLRAYDCPHCGFWHLTHKP